VIGGALLSGLSRPARRQLAALSILVVLGDRDDVASRLEVSGDPLLHPQPILKRDRRKLGTIVADYDIDESIDQSLHGRSPVLAQLLTGVEAEPIAGRSGGDAKRARVCRSSNQGDP
jgi:hypothetical protein